LSPVEYWDLLRPRVASLDMWQTTYMRMKVSGAKPRASRLNGLSAATDEVWEVRNDR
jgi:trans-aconitate methyltransferase